MKDKYSKYEKQTVQYPVIMAFYRFLNGVLHLLLAVELMAAVAFALDWLTKSVFNAVCQVYLLTCVLSLVLLAIMEFTINRKYHRLRYKQ